MPHLLPFVFLSLMRIRGHAKTPIFEEAISALLAAVGDLGREHPAEIWVTFFEHIATYEQLYRTLLGQERQSLVCVEVRGALAELINERRHLPHRPNTSDQFVHTSSDTFVPDLVAAMFMETITWWLEHDRPYTPREIATRSALLAAALFKEAATWQ